MWIALVNDTSSPSSADIRPFGCVLGGEKASKAFFNSAKLYDRYLPHEKEREREEEGSDRSAASPETFVHKSENYEPVPRSLAASAPPAADQPYACQRVTER